MKILRTASLECNFTGSYKKRVYINIISRTALAFTEYSHHVFLPSHRRSVKIAVSKEKICSRPLFYLFIYLFIIYLGSKIVQMVLHPKLKK